MTTTLLDHFDDPVGHWHRCPECHEEIFVPLEQLGIFKYCPLCQLEIILAVE